MIMAAVLNSTKPGTSRKKPMSGEQSCRNQKLWMSDITQAKLPLPGAEKYPDFQVTSCHQNDTKNANFAYIESE